MYDVFLYWLDFLCPLQDCDASSASGTEEDGGSVMDEADVEADEKAGADELAHEDAHDTHEVEEHGLSQVHRKIW